MAEAILAIGILVFLGAPPLVASKLAGRTRLGRPLFPGGNYR